MGRQSHPVLNQYFCFRNFAKSIIIKNVITLQALCPPVVSVQMFPGWMVLPK
jgi:hypothetical protein